MQTSVFVYHGKSKDRCRLIACSSTMATAGDRPQLTAVTVRTDAFKPEVEKQGLNFVDSTCCASIVSHNVCYEICCAWPSMDEKYIVKLCVADEFGNWTWHSPNDCRVVGSEDAITAGAGPVTAQKIERRLSEVQGGAATAPPPAVEPAQKTKGCTDLARTGDRVVIQHGPCPHWVCNAVICPCWMNDQIRFGMPTVGRKVMRERDFKLKASAGL